MKKFIILLIIISLFCSSLFAENFNVKLDRIYSTGDKMMISWNEGKNSSVIVAVREDDKLINLTRYFKVGSIYPASYNSMTELIVYDENGNPHKFYDDTNARKAQEAQLKAEQEAAARAPGEMVGVVIAITLVVVILAVLVAVASTPTSTTK